MRRIPIVKQASWLAVVPQVVVMILMIVITASIAGPRNATLAMLSAMGIFVAYVLLSRHLIPRDHRRGMRLVRKKQFEAAIPHFERSFEFFTRHIWLDKFRCITMLSASSFSYREIALLNAAFCHGQIGNGELAKQYYQKALDAFPDSSMAQAALNMASAFEKNDEPEPTNRDVSS